MILPGWQTLESARNFHSFFELSGLLLFAVLVFFEILEHRHTRNEKLFKVLALISFALAVSAEIMAYPYSTRMDMLSKVNESESQKVILAQSNRLAQAEAEITVQSNALAAAKIEPLKQRLVDCLNSIDDKLIPLLNKYQKHIQLKNMPVRQYQYVQLQSLSMEPGASNYITFKDIPIEIYAGGGQIQRIEIDISPSLVQ